ncbi:MAG: DUF6340 family protein [Bacteroides sp.]|nr:DUF6340 family protein [Bacteroides sp.]
MVEFEVLEPATASLPEEVKQLIVLNRAPVSLNSFEQSDVEGLEEKHLTILDTLIVKSIQRGLLNVFRESPIERFHYPLWLDDRREDTSMVEALILTRREVDDICRKNVGDAILSLESYSMDYEMHVESFLGSHITASMYFEISTIIKWIIYLPGHPKPFDRYTMVDTLFFTEVQNGEVLQRYNNSQIISEAFYKSGRKYGKYLVPVWNTTSRSLYKGKEEALRKASKLTDRGDWDQAYEIWEGLSKGENGTAAAKALYNMAIFNELDDKLDSAAYLVNEALKRDTLELIRNYKEEIDTRILNQKELFEQVR